MNNREYKSILVLDMKKIVMFFMSKTFAFLVTYFVITFESHSNQIFFKITNFRDTMIIYYCKLCSGFFYQ